MILFNRLGRAQMKDIVAIQLGRLRKLLADRRMSLELTERALEWLGNAGYDPVYGARPLKRVIQRALQDPLALMLLEGRLGDGETVRVDAGDGGLVIQGTPIAAAGLERCGRPVRRPPVRPPARPRHGAAGRSRHGAPLNRVRSAPCSGSPPASSTLSGLTCVAVCQQLVVQVRPGREAGGADIADHLALLDPLAGPHARARSVDRWA